MVGGKHDDHVIETHALGHVFEELAKQPVRANRNITDSRIVRTHGMPHVIVRGEADRENIRPGVLAQTFARDRALSELLDHLVAPRRRLETPTVADFGTRNHRAKWWRRIVLGI